MAARRPLRHNDVRRGQADWLRQLASDRRDRWCARLCDAYAAAHKDGLRLDGLRVRKRADGRHNERDAAAKREVGGKARTVDTVGNDEVRLRRVVVRTIEIDDDVLRTGCVTKLDGQRALGARSTRIADDRRQYIEYQRQPYETDPACRTCHRDLEKVSARSIASGRETVFRRTAIPTIVKF